LLTLPFVIAVGVGAALLSDVIWYEIGRARGSQMTRLLCRIALEPDSCMRRSQETFARYGRGALLVAKFVPGLNTVMQPLAGILGMRRSRFLLVDALSARLWVGAYAGLGYLLSDYVERVAAYARQLGSSLVAIALAGLALYIGGKYLRRQRFPAHPSSRRGASRLAGGWFPRREHHGKAVCGEGRPNWREVRAPPRLQDRPATPRGRSLFAFVYGSACDFLLVQASKHR
jgi:membrane protein DedA with SNARE-associated domain